MVACQMAKKLLELPAVRKLELLVAWADQKPVWWQGHRTGSVSDPARKVAQNRHRQLSLSWQRVRQMDLRAVQTAEKGFFDSRVHYRA